MLIVIFRLSLEKRSFLGFFFLIFFSAKKKESELGQFVPLTFKCSEWEKNKERKRKIKSGGRAAVSPTCRQRFFVRLGVSGLLLSFKAKHCCVEKQHFFLVI